MPSPLAPLVTNNEVAFVLQAISHRVLRASGRRPHDVRHPSFAFSPDGAVCTVSLGSDGPTATACVRATLGAPFADRPGEGSLRCSAEVSPAAAASLAGQSSSSTLASLADQLTRLLERSISHPRAVDLEQLCVSPGRAAWSVRVDACLVDAGKRGGASAASAAVLLAASAALRSFRRPDAAVEQVDALVSGKANPAAEQVETELDEDSLPSSSSSKVVVHPASERPPVPLALRLTPVAVAFTFLWSGGGGGSKSSSEGATTLVLDPDAAEEAAAALRGYGCGATSTSPASGLLVSAGAPSGDVLFLDRGVPGSGGAAPVRVGGGIAGALLAARVASAAALEISKELERALREHEEAVNAARVRRHVEKGSGIGSEGVGAAAVAAKALSLSSSRSVAAVGALDASTTATATATASAAVAPVGLPAAKEQPVVSASKKKSESKGGGEGEAAEEKKKEAEEVEMEKDEKEEESDGAPPSLLASSSEQQQQQQQQQKPKKKKKSKSGDKPSGWRSEELRARAGKRSKGSDESGGGNGDGGSGDTLEQIAAMIGGGGGSAGGQRPSLAAAATRKHKKSSKK